MKLRSLALLLNAAFACWGRPTSNYPSMFNVEWNDITVYGTDGNGLQTYYSMMPLGNGRLVCQVWTQPDSGRIVFYVSHANAVDEAQNLLKLGMVEIMMDPNPFQNGNYISQMMDLATSSIVFKIGGSSSESYAVNLRLWVDYAFDVINVEFNSMDDTEYTISSWVQSNRLPYKTAFVYGDFGYCNFDPTLQQIPDFSLPDVLPFSLSNIHFNNISNFNYLKFTLELEWLLEFYDDPEVQSMDQLVNRTFGVVLQQKGAHFSMYKNVTTLQSVGVTTLLTQIFAVSEQVASMENWRGAIQTLHTQYNTKSLSDRWDDHSKFWSDYWMRSYIIVDGTANSTTSMWWNASYLYTLNRYVQYIQASGDYPIKFNGELFSANIGTQADYREWGSANWWQNMRFPYFSMVAQGDFNQIQSSLLEYRYRQLPLTYKKVKKYFNHTGLFWAETETYFGCYDPSNYGCPGIRPPGLARPYTHNTYIRYHWTGSLEMSLLIFDMYGYTENVTMFKRYSEMIAGVLDFYVYRFPNRDANGSVLFFPTQSLETWQCPDWPIKNNDCCTNDLPSIAGLRAVMSRALAPSITGLGVWTGSQIKTWTAFYEKLPPLPTKGGIYQGCQIFPVSAGNGETPEMYATHPYRLYTLPEAWHAKVNLTTSIASFYSNSASYQRNTGWRQGALNAAMLGLKDAERQVLERTTIVPAPGYRFPPFSPPLQDYDPSADHLAVMNNAMQLMLVQFANDEHYTTYIFPNWNCSVDVSFKLFAPLNTLIEVVYTGNAGVQNFTVTPDTRRPYVMFAGCT